MVRFLKDIHDPHYVGNLYNINRPKGSPPEAFKLHSMYRSAHVKFLRAIDHMEFHPTLGRSKEKPEVRLKRQTQEGLK